MTKTLLRCALLFYVAASVSGVRAEDPITINRDVMVNSMTSDRFVWRDSANQPRTAVLAHNTGQTGPGGTRGGELREFRYQVPGGQRIVSASSSYFSGFGYVVSHNYSFDHCSGAGDASSLGHLTTGTFTRVFEGRHHVVFRFTQNYPRYCSSAAPAPAPSIDLPVTIEWVFRTGSDHPLWAVTWDLSAVPVGRLFDDSRAPYGELLFDGSATEASHSTIAGVGWGDRYKFAASSPGGVTLNSAWTWNVANTVPYTKLWTTAVDATMGIVQTQTIQQQDAGGYWGVNRWNSTSATPGCAAYTMPCDYNWPFQTINYSFQAATTRNTRLGWGTNFGFLGAAEYFTHGSAYYGGPLPNTTAPGHPKKSYSTYIVLGTHTGAPVEEQVAQIETVQSVSLSATVGTVAVNGPAGIARQDTVSYQPAGYDHVYGAFVFRAAGNKVDGTINVGAGTLKKPLLIIRNYSGGLPNVKIGGAAAAADVDYFASLRPEASELWVTINRNLAGAGNRIEISAPAGRSAFSTGDVAGRGDFNGDGRSDILLRHENGSLGIWLMNGFAITGGAALSPASPGAGYAVSAIADFNGDSYADILFRDDAGTIRMWLMNGTTVAANLHVGAAGSYQIAGAGDFNGDGRADVLLRDALGNIGMWLMNGGTITSGAFVGSPGAYEVVGVADFNENGRADILLRDATGTLGMWMMNGPVIASGALVGSPGGTYTVAGTADLTGDGASDILLRDAIGNLGLWVMNGSFIVSGGFIASPGGYSVSAVRDYNADGRADILLRDEGGSVGMWLMNGTAITSGGLVAAPGSAYSVY